MAIPSAAAAQRVGRGVPAEWQFAHKTGSSGTVDGVTLAFNDVGMVQVPKEPVAYLSSKSAN